jgi:hypothetical protein
MVEKAHSRFPSLNLQTLLVPPSSGGAKEDEMHSRMVALATLAVLGVGATWARADGPYTCDANTILLWHFDEGSGPTAFDACANHFDGAVVADWTVAGRFGSGLDFSGPEGSKYVWIADDDRLTPGAPAAPQPVTIDVWIRPTRLDLVNQMIVHKYQNHVPANSDYLLLLTNDVLGFGTRGSEVLQATLPDVDRWYHVTAIANGADSRLYVDGALAEAGFLSPVPNGTAPFTVGGCINACAGNNYSFWGTIDEVRLKVGVVPPVMDGDGDGVPDGEDACPGTAPDDVVDADGCSIAQLCPCAAPRGSAEAWRNHGAYVSCVAHAAERFLAAGLLTEAEKDAVVSAAGRSDCGR